MWLKSENQSGTLDKAFNTNEINTDYLYQAGLQRSRPVRWGVFIQLNLSFSEDPLFFVSVYFCFSWPWQQEDGWKAQAEGIFREKCVTPHMLLPIKVPPPKGELWHS